MAFILALLKTRLDFFYGQTDRDGTVGSQKGKPLNFTSSVKFTMALAGVAHWIECSPANQRVAGPIPSQGTCLG